MVVLLKENDVDIVVTQVYECTWRSSESLPSLIVPE